MNKVKQLNLYFILYFMDSDNESSPGTPRVFRPTGEEFLEIMASDSHSIYSTNDLNEFINTASQKHSSSDKTRDLNHTKKFLELEKIQNVINQNPNDVATIFNRFLTDKKELALIFINAIKSPEILRKITEQNITLQHSPKTEISNAIAERLSAVNRISCSIQ